MRARRRRRRRPRPPRRRSSARGRSSRQDHRRRNTGATARAGLSRHSGRSEDRAGRGPLRRMRESDVQRARRCRGKDRVRASGRHIRPAEANVPRRAAALAWRVDSGCAPSKARTPPRNHSNLYEFRTRFDEPAATITDDNGPVSTLTFGSRLGHTLGLRPDRSPSLRRFRGLPTLTAVPDYNLSYVYVFAFFEVGAGLVSVMMLLSHLLAPFKPTREKLRTYESGEEPVGQGGGRYPTPLFIFAPPFVVFGLSVAF